MKTQLIFDYENSKAFQYYFYMLGELKLTEDIEDDEIISYFGFNNEIVTIGDLVTKYKKQLEQRLGILNMLTSLVLFDDIRLLPCNDDVYLGNKGARIHSDFEYERIGIFYNTKPIKKSQKVINKALDLLKIYKKDIISAINDDDSFMRLRYVSPDCPVFETYIENEMYLDALEQNDRKPLKKFFDSINPLSGLENFSRMRDFWDAERLTYESYIDKAFLHIYNVLSSKTGYSLSNRFHIPSSGHSIDIDNLNKSNESINLYIAEMKFNEGTFMIPQPESFEGVADLRKDPRIISFREVYAQWIKYLQDEDEIAARKIWNDVLKAKESLDKINSYKKIDENILTRCLLMIGGEIPILSEMLSGYGFVTATAIDKIEKKIVGVIYPLCQIQ